MCWYYAERFCSFSLPLSLPQSNSRLSHNALRHASKNRIHFGSSEASFFPFPISRYHTFNYSSGRNSCAQCASNLMKNKSKWERKWQTNKNPPQTTMHGKTFFSFYSAWNGIFNGNSGADMCSCVCVLNSVYSQNMCFAHTYIDQMGRERASERSRSNFILIKVFFLFYFFFHSRKFFSPVFASNNKWAVLSFHFAHVKCNTWSVLTFTSWVSLKHKRNIHVDACGCFCVSLCDFVCY